MKRHSSAASLALAALVVLELAGPVAASTFRVLNVADDGFGSLRAAIAAANARPGADVIHFTRQVRGTIVLTSGPAFYSPLEPFFTKSWRVDDE
jgi:hypothetical protein